MSKPILRFPVYEPAGRDVTLTASDLLQHILVIGATGSGKTVLLQRGIDELVGMPDLGLLIIDAKQEGIVERVRSLARNVDRSKDVIVLGPTGDHYLDLFGNLRSLADVDSTAQRLLLAAGSMGKENAFWEEARAAMIDAALTLLVASGRPLRFTSACQFMGQWFFRPELTQQIAGVLEAAQTTVERCHGAFKQKLLHALDMAEMWRNLDTRTRSNIASSLACLIKPLLGISAASCFRPSGRKVFRPSEVVRGRRICVASLNATADSSLAWIFFRMLKSDFFREVQQAGGSSRPVCGMIADEWPLIASAEDGEALATVRSRGFFIIAATQGLAAIDERVGVRQRKAMVTNFGTLIFLRSREEEVDLLAAVHLGTRRRLARKESTAMGDLVVQEKRKSFYDELVCPPGTLGRLSPHEGFVAFPGKGQCDLPRTFVPWFEETDWQRDPEIDRISVGHLEQLLTRAGLVRRVAPDLFVKVMAICAAEFDHASAVLRAREFFRARAVLVPEGLERIPSPWLVALPGILWSARRPGWTHLPYMMNRVEVVNGLLLMQFAQEADSSFGRRITSFDRLRIRVNASVYPHLYRPLKPEHSSSMAQRRRRDVSGAEPELNEDL